MGVHFSPAEGCAISELWAEVTGDIVVTTNRDGFIVEASPELERIPFAAAGGLFGRHLLDLVHPSRGAAVMAGHEAAIAGRRDGGWIEFPARTLDGEERWFEMRSRGVIDDAGRVRGAVSVMRSIHERRCFEEKLFVAAMTDYLTGLTNRSAFVSMLGHLVEAHVGGCLAMFDLDHFKAINMRYGHAVGDQLLVAFAELIRGVAGPDDIISRIGGESFGILFPQAPLDHAEKVCRQIVAALGEPRGAGSLPMTVSAGLAPISVSLDAAIKSAELALTVAKAKGRNRLEIGHLRPALGVRKAG